MDNRTILHSDVRSGPPVFASLNHKVVQHRRASSSPPNSDIINSFPFSKLISDIVYDHWQVGTQGGNDEVKFGRRITCTTSKAKNKDKLISRCRYLSACASYK